MSDDIRENQFLADIRSAAQGQPTYYDLDPVINKEKYYADIITALKNGGGGGGFTPTTAQLAAMNSGINSTEVTQIETNKNNISSIEDKMPYVSNINYNVVKNNMVYANKITDNTTIASGVIGDATILTTRKSGRIALSGTLNSAKTAALTNNITFEQGKKYTYFVYTPDGAQNIYVAVKNVKQNNSNVQTNQKNKAITFTPDNTVTNATINFYNSASSAVTITGDYYIYVVEGEYSDDDFDLGKEISENKIRSVTAERDVVILQGNKYIGTAVSNQTKGYKYPTVQGHTYKFINNASDPCTMNVYVSKTSEVDVQHQVLSNVGRQYIREFTADDNYEYVHVYATGSQNFTLVDMNGLSTEREVVPDYYASYIENKIAEINNIESECGLHGDSFVFMTDYHRQANSENSNKLIKKILDDTHARFLLFGGDTQDTVDSKTGGINQMKLFNDKFKNISDRMYSILGNHEFNPYTMDETASQYMLDYNQTYRMMLKAKEGNYGNISEYGNYWIDNEAQKIRYICTTTDGFCAMETTSVKWVLNAIKDTPNNYFIVIFSHLTFDVNSTDNTKVYLRNGIVNVAQALDAYNARSTYTYDGDTFDFTNCGATALCVIGGHTHFDMDSSQEDKFLIPEWLPQTMPDTMVIATTTDAYMRQNKQINVLERTVSTVTEQAFDYISIDTQNLVVDTIRVGAGANRTFHLAVITSAATLTSKLSGTVTWSSSNTAVATVTDGAITQVSTGRTRIVAKDENGNSEIWTVKFTS